MPDSDKNTNKINPKSERDIRVAGQNIDKRRLRGIE